MQSATTTATLPDNSTRDETARANKTLEVSDAPVLGLTARFNEIAVNPGQVATANFFLDNQGGDSANNVALRVRVPKGTRLRQLKGIEISGGYSGRDASWSCDEQIGNDLTPCEEDQLITVTWDDITEGDYSNVEIRLVVDDPTDVLRVEIAAALTGTDGESEESPELLPQAASAQVQVVDGPILVVEQRSSQAIVAPGGKVIYDIFAENKSSIDANNALLTDDIPGDTRVVGAPGSTTTDSGVEWSVPMGGYEEIGQTIALEVAGNAEVGTVLDNRVQLSSGMQVAVAEPDPVQIGLLPLLRTDIATTPEVAAPGKPLIYTVGVENKGNLAAPPGAFLTLSLPSDVTLSECDDCEVEDNRLTWDLRALRPEQRVTKTVSVTVKDVDEDTRLIAASFVGRELGEMRSSSGGTLKQALLRLQSEQRAGAMAAGSDRTTTNQLSGRLALASTLVAEASATTIAVTATDEVIRGGQIGVDAVITNAGSAAAAPATVTTVLPPGTQLAYLGSGGSCSTDPCIAGSTLSWTLGAQVPGAERTISYALSVDNDADYGPRIHVLEHKDANFTQPQIGTATTTVVPGVLSLDKSVTAADDTLNPTYAEIGETVTYTLRVTNGNPEGTPDLVVDVTDVLPAEVIDCGSCLSLAGSGASLSGNTLTWSKLSLGSGEAIELSYDVTIPTVASTVALDNLAHVRSTTGQTDDASVRLEITSIGELGLTLAAPAGLQPDASGKVVITYQNTGTAATTATLSYLLPDKLSVTDSAGASASGSTYTWSLGSLAAKATGSKTLTVKAAADAPAGDVLTHSATLEGSGSNLSAKATDTTVIGSVTQLDIAVNAPSSLTTGDTFTATVVATNSGNTDANGTTVTLTTLPAGFTVSDAVGGTVGGQAIKWTFDIPAGTTKTLKPILGAPAAAASYDLIAEVAAASRSQVNSASKSVQVTSLTSAAIQAAAQFSVAEAKTGDSVTLIAGPANVGGAASGTITNTVTLSAGLTATAFDSASWNADTRVLSWTTSSLPSRGSDPKTFTVRVEDAGALTATASSDGAEGTATMVRTFPEEVTITPEVPGSSCKLSGQPSVAPAPTPPAGITLSFANTVGFTVIDCDRNPNTSYPEKLTVTIDVGQDIAADAQLYKVSGAGAWAVIEDAVITGQTVTYSITDDGELDQDKTPGTLRDPVALAVPEGDAPPPVVKPVLPVPLPLWLLAALIGSVGWLGYRRLRLA